MSVTDDLDVVVTDILEPAQDRTVFTVDFVEEFCEEFEFRTIEEHNMCANVNAAEILDETQVAIFLFLNIAFGFFIGYVGVRGVFDPWR